MIVGKKVRNGIFIINTCTFEKVVGKVKSILRSPGAVGERCQLIKWE